MLNLVLFSAVVITMLWAAITIMLYLRDWCSGAHARIAVDSGVTEMIRQSEYLLNVDYLPTPVIPSEFLPRIKLVNGKWVVKGANSVFLEMHPSMSQIYTQATMWTAAENRKRLGL